MADITFNTAAGQVIAREMLIAAVKVDSKYYAFGTHVPDSSEEYDWQEETEKDIRGNTFVTAKTPIITQSFDPLPLLGGNKAIEHVWNVAIKDQDAAAMVAQDCVILHTYAGTSGSTFAERYDACMVKPTGLGGEGGGNISMPIEITYGGTRTVGTGSITGDEVTFTPANG